MTQFKTLRQVLDALIAHGRLTSYKEKLQDGRLIETYNIQGVKAELYFALGKLSDVYGGVYFQDVYFELEGGSMLHVHRLNSNVVLDMRSAYLDFLHTRGYTERADTDWTMGNEYGVPFNPVINHLDQVGELIIEESDKVDSEGFPKEINYFVMFNEDESTKELFYSHKSLEYQKEIWQLATKF